MTQNPLAGAAMMALGMLLIPVSDGIAKLLLGMTDYQPAFLAWSRFALGICVVAPVALMLGAFRGLGWPFIRGQAVRGALIAATITLIVTGAGKAPLADVFGAFFIGPVVATILAALLLKERVKPLEWWAVALGFAGVMLVIQPSGEMHEGLVWGFVAGCCYGAFLTATRWTANTAPPMAQLAGQLFFGLLFLAPLGVGDLAAHGLQSPGWLIAMGTSSALANLFALFAFRQARAAYLAPVVYVQIIGAMTIGWMVFGDIPDLLAFAGLLLILAAGATRIPYSAFRK